jgi:hypothetical protein
MSLFDPVLAQQEHVVSRAQVLELGGTDRDITRLLRRRVWAQVHPGVYVDHTGPPTREQHEWAAVLYCAPAALAGRSALRRYGVRLGRDADKDEPADLVHVAVARHRRVESRPTIRTVRLSRFEDDVLTNLSPPRVRLEMVVLDLAAASDEMDAVAVISASVQGRRTTPDRLLAALELRPRLRHRSLLRRVLVDVASGAYSVMEREYLLRVERPHGLPIGNRQRHVRRGRSNTYRDIEYVGLEVVVELDGRLGHELARDRWDDLERDLDSLVAGAVTARLSWAQVLDPCRTAHAIAALLVSRGWDGAAKPCSPTCPLIGGVQLAPGASQTPQPGP